jgi:hypothetical protein
MLSPFAQAAIVSTEAAKQRMRLNEAGHEG